MSCPGMLAGGRTLGTAERKGRERDQREQRIIAATRMIAEQEGWSAVTIRRLADEIEYSQPVIYSHFKSRDAIVAAVAVEGFREVAATLRQAARGIRSRRRAVESVVKAYLTFASDNPALYAAMYIMPIDLRFAQADTKAELRDAFVALTAVVSPSCADVDLATETLWAALHGLAELESSGRIRPGARDARIGLVVDALLRS